MRSDRTRVVAFAAPSLNGECQSARCAWRLGASVRAGSAQAASAYSARARQRPLATADIQIGYSSAATSEQLEAEGGGSATARIICTKQRSKSTAARHRQRHYPWTRALWCGRGRTAALPDGRAKVGSGAGGRTRPQQRLYCGPRMTDHQKGTCFIAMPRLDASNSQVCGATGEGAALALLDRAGRHCVVQRDRVQCWWWPPRHRSWRRCPHRCWLGDFAQDARIAFGDSSPCDGNDRAVWAQGTVVYQIGSGK